jgi:hypothetical protein
MQSFSSKEEEKLTQAHEYIRDTLSFRHKNCISCGTRTEFTCIKCGFCYSCHWKKEQVEEIELRDNLKDFYTSLSKPGVDDEDDNDKSKLQSETRDQGLAKWGTLNALGQPAEPICTYYRCHHKFSLHGSRGCRCKHPTNKTLGVLMRHL